VCIYVSMYTMICLCALPIYLQAQARAFPVLGGGFAVTMRQYLESEAGTRHRDDVGFTDSQVYNLSVTRYSLFGCCCARINHLFPPPPRPPELPTLVQYVCTIIGQYTTPPPTARVYNIHHATLVVITISCKGQCIIHNYLLI